MKSHSFVEISNQDIYSEIVATRKELNEMRSEIKYLEKIVYGTIAGFVTVIGLIISVVQFK